MLCTMLHVALEPEPIEADDDSSSEEIMGYETSDDEATMRNRFMAKLEHNAQGGKTNIGVKDLVRFRRHELLRPSYMRAVLQSGLFQMQDNSSVGWFVNETEPVKWPLAFVIAVLNDDWWHKKNMARDSEFGLDKVPTREVQRPDQSNACFAGCSVN